MNIDCKELQNFNFVQSDEEEDAAKFSMINPDLLHIDLEDSDGVSIAPVQARNQEFFRAGELKLGQFDNDLPTTRTRKAPLGKNIPLFCLEALKNCILNGTFYPKMTTIKAFFPQIPEFFSNFEKGQRRPPPSSPLVTPLLLHQQ